MNHLLVNNLACIKMKTRRLARSMPSVAYGVPGAATGAASYESSTRIKSQARSKIPGRLASRRWSASARQVRRTNWLCSVRRQLPVFPANQIPLLSEDASGPQEIAATSNVLERAPRTLVTCRVRMDGQGARSAPGRHGPPLSTD